MNNSRVARSSRNLLMVLFFSAALSFTPSPSPSGPPTSSPSPAASINSKTYLNEFVRAQNSEIKALEHRHKLELKELKTTHKIHLQEWERNEKLDRHKYFEEHSKGPDRREYIQSFIKRREELFKKQADDYGQKVQEFKRQVQDEKHDHEQKLREFQKALSVGETPSSSLWPKPGN